MKKASSTTCKILYCFFAILCFFPFTKPPYALAGGFLFSLLLGHPFPKLTGKVTSMLLKISVVGLGFGMTAESAVKAGSDGFFLTIGSIVFVMVAGYFIGRWLLMPDKQAHLISSGTAICGGSAIAAVAPAVGASDKEISVSLGVIFLLNSVALLIFPAIGHWFDLSSHQFGLWCAIAIHDTSSVVGAASAYSKEALDVATTVKLARTLWIIPLSLVSALLFKNKNSKISIPWFVGFFILAMLANTYIPMVGEYGSYIATAARASLVLTLFLIGSSLSVEKLKSVGWKPLILGIILWIAISIGSLFCINYFNTL